MNLFLFCPSFFHISESVSGMRMLFIYVSLALNTKIFVVIIEQMSHVLIIKTPYLNS